MKHSSSEKSPGLYALKAFTQIVFFSHQFMFVPVYTKNFQDFLPSIVFSDLGVHKLSMLLSVFCEVLHEVLLQATKNSYMYVRCVEVCQPLSGLKAPGTAF